MLESLQNYERVEKQSLRKFAGELFSKVGLDLESVDLYPYNSAVGSSNG
ncbi:hypothetical protein [Brevibacillus reuszeri]